MHPNKRMNQMRCNVHRAHTAVPIWYTLTRLSCCFLLYPNNSSMQNKRLRIKANANGLVLLATAKVCCVPTWMLVQFFPLCCFLPNKQTNKKQQHTKVKYIEIWKWAWMWCSCKDVHVQFERSHAVKKRITDSIPGGNEYRYRKICSFFWIVPIKTRSSSSFLFFKWIFNAVFKRNKNEQEKFSEIFVTISFPYYYCSVNTMDISQWVRIFHTKPFSHSIFCHCVECQNYYLVFQAFIMLFYSFLCYSLVKQSLRSTSLLFIHEYMPIAIVLLHKHTHTKEPEA